MAEEHKPPQQQAAELKEAAKQVIVGYTYCHYKNPSSRYKVKELAVLEADDSICVIYESQTTDMPSFVRPLSEWIETVKWKGQTLPRFRKLDAN